MQTTKNDNLVTKSIDFVTTSVVKLMCRQKITIASAESCTGGLLSAAITSVPGSSEIFELGIVSYSNRIKSKMLGVREETLEKFGAVSEQTALEMARGVMKASGAQIGVGITGIAGPTGAVPGKPIGTVFAAVIRKTGDGEKVLVKDLKLYNERKDLTRELTRDLTVLRTFEMIRQICADDALSN